MPLLKICGITRVEDVEMVDRLADYAGFIVARGKVSPRVLEPGKAVDLASTLSKARPVLVAANMGVEEAIDLYSRLEVFKVLQYHAPLPVDLAVEAAEELAALGGKLAPVVTVWGGTFHPRHPRDYVVVDYEYLLVDAVKGSTTVYAAGLKLSPIVFLDAVESAKRVGIAGGVTPFNAHIVVSLGPHLVDVSSGVEERPGVKDHVLVEKLARVVKGEVG